jgi:pyruvate carboxylase subunit B
MDLTLRDGHQSLFATRGRTEDMIPVAELMDEVGFWAVETWGGATFDTMHRFLNEDPWERLRTLKRYIKKTPFSMLLRAQNLVGYRNYADDLAYAFVERTAENGMDIFRTFRCAQRLSQLRNGGLTDQEVRQALPGLHLLYDDRTAPRRRGLQPRLLYQKAKDLESWAPIPSA